MLTRTPLALTACLLLAACASTAVRYTDPSGRQHAGSVDPVKNVITAEIAGRTYRGPFATNEWGQARSTLVSRSGERLYCDFFYRALKVKGSCTDLAGGEYALESR